MQTTSETYKTLLAKGTNVTSKEVRATIGLDEYYQDQLVEVKTTSALMTGDNLIGNCIASALDIKILNPNTIPRMAKIDLYVRLNDGTTQSEWLPKGVFFIDTREYDETADQLTIHAYDAMLKTEQSFTQAGDQGEWPRTDIAVVKEIAYRIGLSTSASATDGIDSRTLAILTNGYAVQYPGITLEDGTPQYSTDGAYSMREVLGFIGAMYGGNWCVSDEGKLRLVPLKKYTLQTITERITSSGTWTAPNNLIGTVHGLIVGGGGGGYSEQTSSVSGSTTISNNAGGSGYYIEVDASIYPNEQVSVTIGDGGLGRPVSGIRNSTNGGETRFGQYAALGGKRATNSSAGDGGAGGGGGVTIVSRYSSGSTTETCTGKKGGNSSNFNGASGSASGTPKNNSYGGGGAGAGGNATTSTGGSGVTINGISCFNGGNGGFATSGSSMATGGQGYDGFGDGGNPGASGKKGLVELTYSIIVEG